MLTLNSKYGKEFVIIQNFNLAKCGGKAYIKSVSTKTTNINKFTEDT